MSMVKHQNAYVLWSGSTQGVTGALDNLLLEIEDRLDDVKNL
jgi:hypothetical protein